MRRTQSQLKEEIIKHKAHQENNIWYGYRICPGCIEEIKYSSVKRFILLRTIRNLENRNAVCSSCNKKGKLNHFYGKHHSEESTDLISKNRTGKACGINNSMSKQKYRDSVSMELKKKYDNGDLDFLRKIQSDNAIKNQANGKLKTAPISSAEKEIKKNLENCGHKIVSQFKINSLRYDLLVEDKNILIEYNGDYWHCNPSKYKSSYFHKKKKLFAKDIWEHDLRKKQIAEENGYKLFIIWESDYMFNKEKEIKKITDKI